MTTPNDSNAPAPDANAPNPGAEPPGAGAGTPYQPAAGAPRKPRATFLDNCMATANGRLLVLLTGATLVIIGSIVAMAAILTALAILLTLSFGVLLTGVGASAQRPGRFRGALGRHHPHAGNAGGIPAERP